VKVVLLNCYEVDFLIKENNKLLTKFYLYTKYHCLQLDNYNKHNNTDLKQDFTAKQFFKATGYTCNSKDYENKLTEIRKKIRDNGFMDI